MSGVGKTGTEFRFPQMRPWRMGVVRFAGSGRV